MGRHVYLGTGSWSARWSEPESEVEVDERRLARMPSTGRVGGWSASSSATHSSSSKAVVPCISISVLLTTSRNCLGDKRQYVKMKNKREAHVKTGREIVLRQWLFFDLFLQLRERRRQLKMEATEKGKGVGGLRSTEEEDPHGDTSMLQSFGYDQELSRSLGPLTSFGLAFSYTSPTVGAYTLFAFGLATGTPGCIVRWGLLLEHDQHLWGGCRWRALHLGSADRGGRPGPGGAHFCRVGGDLPDGRCALPVGTAAHRTTIRLARGYDELHAVRRRRPGDASAEANAHPLLHPFSVGFAQDGLTAGRC